MNIIAILEESERFNSAVSSLIASNPDLRNIFISDLNFIAKKFSLYTDDASMSKEYLVTGIYVYASHPKVINDKGRFSKPEVFASLNDKSRKEVNDLWINYGKKFFENEFVKQDSLYLPKYFRDSEFFDKIAACYYRFSLIMTHADGIQTDVMKSEVEKLKSIYSEIYGKEVTPVSSGSTTQTFSGGGAENRESLEEILMKLNGLIGMDRVKEDVKTLINFIRVQKARIERGLAKTNISLHTVFYGPPGTGKTTVARLIGKIFQAMGLLEKGHLVEVDRSGLVAGYVGQTAEKVDNVVKEAMDGVLFIDEAYTLKPENDGSDYGQEAIDSLLKRMEDNREKLVVIVAGYKDEMDRFLNSNPGMKSRFNRYFYFDNYKPEELLLIFKKMIKDGSYSVTPRGEAKLLTLLTSQFNNKDKTFGNGRLVRNIFEKCVEKQANRLASLSSFSDDDLIVLDESDIPETI